MVSPALVWPGFDSHAAALPRRMRRRLARARRSEFAATDSLALVCAALGIDPLSPAPLGRLADGGGTDARAWYFAEPTTFVADRDRLVLLPLAEPLDEAESEALLAALRDHFGNEGLVCERRGGRWYFFHPDIVEAHTPSPAVAAEGSADPAAFGGGDARTLARILNEVQMLWHAHPVNEARRRAGRAAANGLWVWGGGDLPQRPPIPVQARLFGGGPEIAGLARWLGCAHAPLVAPDRVKAAEGFIAVVEADESEPGAAWLAALVGAGSAFTLLTRNAVLEVPARHRWLSLGR